jgi:hypothetical protein
LAQDVTIYLVNGSSLGGGEMDSIMRAKLLGGTIVVATEPAAALVELAQKHSVPMHRINYLWSFSTRGRVHLHLSRFIRDVSAIPLLLKLRAYHGSRLTVTIGLHSDPLAGLEPPKMHMLLALRVFELFCIVFANRIRLVSRRQLWSFPLIARWGCHFIDPPCSSITLGEEDSVPTVRDLDFVFIGRISRTRYLGDAKNAAFLLDLAQSMRPPNKLHIFGDGNNTDLLACLKAQSCVSTSPPLSDVGLVLRRTRCLVVPSLHEGYCLIVREASLLGCRVLTTEAIADELKNLPGVEIITGFSPDDWLAAGRGKQ